MVYKIKICTSTCPYCGATISREYYGPSIWGPKFGRCPRCKNIFKTNKRLYSDVPKEERDTDRKEFLQGVAITIPLFLVSLLITIFTGWELVGLLAFFALLGTIIFCSVYFSKTRIVMSKYSHLKTSDPELFQLEYNESMRLVGGQSIEEIENQIQNTIEHKILRYFICFIPSLLISEFILMVLVGNSVEGAKAIMLLLLVSIPVSIAVYFIVNTLKKNK